MNQPIITRTRFRDPKHRPGFRADLKTYARLLTYLRGTGSVVVVVIFFMILEALFTVASVGAIKPLLDIALDEPIISETVFTEKPDTNFIDRYKQDALALVAPRIQAIQRQAAVDIDYKLSVMRWIVGVMLISGLLMVASAFFVGYLSKYLATRAVLKLRNDLYSHMIQLDLDYYNRHSTGTLMSNVIQDVSIVDGAIDVIFSAFLKNPIKVFVFVFMMFLISPSLTIFTLIVVPVIGGLIYLIGRRIRRISQKVQRVRAYLSTILDETFSGIRVVKAYNREKEETIRFKKRSTEVFRMGLKTGAAEELGASITQFLGMVTVSLVIIAGVHYVFVVKELQGSTFFIFAGLLTQVFRPMKGWSKVSSRIQTGLAGCDRVFAVLDTKSTIVNRPDAAIASPLQDSIQFHDVGFHYYGHAEQPALSNINLTIRAGTSVALVGKTSSGKSTLSNLIPRFYDPASGSITYDGIDLRDLNVESLRNQIALVTQDSILFDTSVAANISYGLDREATLQEIQHAAKLARAHEFIMRLPQQYDTEIGSRGSRLSGGEKQRISMARAILKNAPILILDEATSALDSETESLIQEAMDELMKDRTVLVIAHRLSTIQNCNMICVLERGRIIEKGTHDELMLLDESYANFYRIQFALPNSV